MRHSFYPAFQYSWVAAAVGAGTLIYGAVSKGKANKKAKQLAAERPVLKDSPYTGEELSLLRNELSTGMSADASRTLQEGNDRSLSSSLDTILKGGGDVNNVAEIFDASQTGNQRLALLKENLRMNNIKNYIGALGNKEQERQQQFQYNEYAPWADQSQANAEAKRSAEQTMWSGVNTAGGALAGKFSNTSGNNALSAYLKGAGGGGGGSVAPRSSVDNAPVNNSGSPSVAGQYDQIGDQGMTLNYNYNNSSNSDIWQ